VPNERYSFLISRVYRMVTIRGDISGITSLTRTARVSPFYCYGMLVAAYGPKVFVFSREIYLKRPMSPVASDDKSRGKRRK
jgi:hypothetical protein